MSPRRILIVGVDTPVGARLARRLERDPEVEVILGTGRARPATPLQRTEVIAIGSRHAALRRIVEAVGIDTVIDLRMSLAAAAEDPREERAIGGKSVLAACGWTGSPVRAVVVESSAAWYGYERDDPAYLAEQLPRTHRPRLPEEREVVAMEETVVAFVERHPDLRVAVLRPCDAIGPGVRSPLTDLLALPVVPGVLGFDPRVQVVHEDDLVAAFHHAATRDLHGVFNVAGDGVLALSELASLVGHPFVPLLPPWGTGLVAGSLRRLGPDLSADLLALLRHGRALDNRRLKATGFRYLHTSREAILALAASRGRHPDVPGGDEDEDEVERFLRTRAVMPPAAAPDSGDPGRVRLADVRAALAELGIDAPDAARTKPAAARTSRRRPATPRKPLPPAPLPLEDYDELDAEEIVALLPQLDPDGLQQLRRHEERASARPGVLQALDSMLARTT